MADSVAGSLRRLGYSVNRHSFSAATSSGPKTLVNVTATLAGQSNDTILIVSHRDALHSPGVADLSGTAVMLELARVLGGETAYHTLVLASVSCLEQGFVRQTSSPIGSEVPADWGLSSQNDEPRSTTASRPLEHVSVAL